MSPSASAFEPIDPPGDALMSLADPPRKTLTAEELVALPDDGISREIRRGELREWPGEFFECSGSGRPVTMRNRVHSKIETRIATILRVWLDNQPMPRGEIHSGEAGFRLRRNPETLVGIDVAYASAELVASTDPNFAFYEGPPILAVEILSPSDQVGDITEKVKIYLEVGTVVWVVDPDFQTLRVHRPGCVAETYNETHELSGEPELPGFRVVVADLFA